jgi:hypothetical protein
MFGHAFLSTVACIAVKSLELIIIARPLILIRGNMRVVMIICLAGPCGVGWSFSRWLMLVWVLLCKGLGLL